MNLIYLYIIYESKVNRPIYPMWAGHSTKPMLQYFTPRDWTVYSMSCKILSVFLSQIINLSSYPWSETEWLRYAGSVLIYFNRFFILHVYGICFCLIFEREVCMCSAITSSLTVITNTTECGAISDCLDRTESHHSSFSRDDHSNPAVATYRN